MKKMSYIILCLQFSLLHFGMRAQEATEAPPPEQGLIQTLIMVGLALLFFYLILLRPEQKRRKAMEAQRNALKKGDKVVAMGIVGLVAQIQDQTVILRMHDGSKIEVLKAAITEVIPPVEGEVKKSETESQ
jgi:preprotein translocase subunit YajC